MAGAKPFDIPKRELWEAFKCMKANQGAAGVDEQSVEDFELRLAANLYNTNPRDLLTHPACEIVVGMLSSSRGGRRRLDGDSVDGAG